MMNVMPLGLLAKQMAHMRVLLHPTCHGLVDMQASANSLMMF